MKRFLILLCSLTLVLAVTMSASAEPVIITFDEEEISANCPPQGFGDLITDQYLGLGVEWIVDPISEQPHNEVTRGECFNQPFDIGSNNQILWYNGTTVEGNIQLDFLADSLAFDYRKPASDDQVQVKLYNGLNVVYDSGVFWAHGYWQTFVYNATDPSGYFDRIQMYGPENKKFVIDNLEVEPVPVIVPPVIERIRGVKEPGKVIRINGSGFGDMQGNSEVHIGPKVYGPGHTKIKLWTDTQIRVKLLNYTCAWFNGNDYRRRKIWVMVGGEDGVSSNVKGIKVLKPDTCP
jgi:hypothetical protein